MDRSSKEYNQDIEIVEEGSSSFGSSGSSSLSSTNSSVELQSAEIELFQLEANNFTIRHEPSTGLHALRRAVQRRIHSSRSWLYWQTNDHTPAISICSLPICSLSESTPSLVSVGKYARSRSHILLPSFLYENITPRRNTSTAYLDGVRGVACFIVYCSHVYRGLSFRKVFPKIDRLPVLSSLLNGPAMVAVFFIVSGFAISHRSITQRRKWDISSFVDTIASSVMRRWPRLFFPVIAITLLEAIMAYVGLEGHQMAHFQPSPRFERLWEQLRYTYNHLKFYANPLRGANSPDDPLYLNNGYDQNTWTLPFEYAGSMVVFLHLVAMTRLTARLRIVGIGISAAVWFYFRYWYLHCFLVGLLLAELHCIREGHSTCSQLPDLEKRVHNTSVWYVYWTIHLLIALYLVSIPPNLKDPTPGFQMAWNWTPKIWRDEGVLLRFWTTIGATYLMIVLEFATFLQMAFTHPFAQYLGRISFCLYLIHSTILKTFGWWLHDSVLGNTSNVVKAVLSYILLTPVVIWAADVLTRLVDKKIIALNRWSYSRLCQAQL